MARFGISASLSATASNFTMIHATSAAGVRAAVNHVLLGTTGTPANLAAQYHISRTSAVPTVTTVLPQPLDFVTSASALTLSSTGVNATVEPTFATAPLGVLLNIGLNQQATFQWWANPGFELCAFYAVTAGIALREVASGYTVGVASTLHWAE